jgi:hypothetical protein
MRQVGSIGMRDQLVINHRQPVAEGFEPLPHRDLLRSVKLIKRARFDGGDQAVKAVSKASRARSIGARWSRLAVA